MEYNIFKVKWTEQFYASLVDEIELHYYQFYRWILAFMWKRKICFANLDPQGKVKDSKAMRRLIWIFLLRMSEGTLSHVKARVTPWYWF